jgi:hypothetical protein
VACKCARQTIRLTRPSARFRRKEQAAQIYKASAQLKVSKPATELVSDEG